MVNLVSYFYNASIEKPLHYGRMFYALSEVNMDKSSIEMGEILIKELIVEDYGIFPYLEEFAYCGFRRNKMNKFDELSEEEIRHLDRKVFPCMYEI